MTQANRKIRGWVGKSTLLFRAYRQKLKASLLEKLWPPMRPLSEIVSSIRLVSTCNHQKVQVTNRLTLKKVCKNAVLPQLSLELITDHFGAKSDITRKNFLPIEHPRLLSSVQDRNYAM